MGEVKLTTFRHPEMGYGYLDLPGGFWRAKVEVPYEHVVAKYLGEARPFASSPTRLAQVVMVSAWTRGGARRKALRLWRGLQRDATVIARTMATEVLETTGPEARRG